MAFHPQVDQGLAIDSIVYRFTEHPSAPGMPYGQEGRTAIVYQLALQDDDRRYALKVFKSRYRFPSLVALVDHLAPFASLPGLQVCRRSVLTPQHHTTLLRQYPDLAYAVLMPWVEGPTWMEVMLEKRPLTSAESLALARSLAEDLVAMEQRGLAHCDLSASNVILPSLADGEGVALVDVEGMYGPGLEQPREILSGSPGYAHRTASKGLWGAEADRFAGAVLIAEMLGWCDERVREAAWGEQYFAKEDIQEKTGRCDLLIEILEELWGQGVTELFGRVWHPKTLVICPKLEEWQAVLCVQTTQPEEDIMELENPRKRLARASVEKAEALIAIGQMERGLEELEEAHQVAPEFVSEAYAHAIVEYAVQWEEAGDIRKAISYYQRALQVMPEESPLWQEVTSVIRRLEETLSETKEGDRSVLRRQVPAITIALWLMCMVGGWVEVTFLSWVIWIGDTPILSWMAVGAITGVVQWWVARKVAHAKSWWILIALTGWAGSWLLGTLPATAITSQLYDAQLIQSIEAWKALWWSIAWLSSFLVNVVFNGIAALLLFADGRTTDRA
jgi:tetratricopeptide (TPR) repeat protein